MRSVSNVKIRPRANGKFSHRCSAKPCLFLLDAAAERLREHAYERSPDRVFVFNLRRPDGSTQTVRAARSRRPHSLDPFCDHLVLDLRLFVLPVEIQQVTPRAGDTLKSRDERNDGANCRLSLDHQVAAHNEGH